MKKTTFACVSGLALAFAGAAHGQVTPISEFSGEFMETFQNVPNYSCPPCFVPQLDILQGQAVMTQPGGGSNLHITGGWGFNCSIGACKSPSLFGSAGGAVEITFAEPAARFGGCMGTNQNNPDGTIEFYDINGTLMASETIDTGSCGQWVWNGWESATGFKRVIIRGNHSSQGFLMLDDLQLDLGAVTCYPDCDGNEVLNVDDFICFQLEFALQNPYADCDENGVFNIDDFLCFQLAFALGC